MRYAVTFATLAAATGSAAASVSFGPAALTLGNAAAGFVLLAVAYACNRPDLLGKRPDGRRAWWAWPPLWPYFLLNAVAFRLAVQSVRQPAFAEVAPNLWFGRRLSASEASAAGVGWVAVLDLAAESPEAAPLRSLPAYRSLPTLDATPPAASDLREAVEWLCEQTTRGPVYIHCALGHGRTGTVVAAYLLATGLADNVPEAVERLRSLRPGVGLNPSQLAALPAAE